MQGSDLAELRRHCYSNSVDPYTVKQLVNKTFPRCRCKELNQQCGSLTPSEVPVEALDSNGTAMESPLTGSKSAPLPLRNHSRCCAGHEVAIAIEATVQALDAREECLATLLCYLELQGWVEVLSPVLDVCTLKCYGGSRQLRSLARKVPAVAAATARLRQQGEFGTVLLLQSVRQCTRCLRLYILPTWVLHALRDSIKYEYNSLYFDSSQRLVTQQQQ